MRELIFARKKRPARIFTNNIIFIPIPPGYRCLDETGVGGRDMLGGGGGGDGGIVTGSGHQEELFENSTCLPLSYCFSPTTELFSPEQASCWKKRD